MTRSRNSRKERRARSRKVSIEEFERFRQDQANACYEDIKRIDREQMRSWVRAQDIVVTGNQKPARQAPKEEA